MTIFKKGSVALSVSLLALSAGQSIAGGLDRSGQGVNLIFEEGRVLQFSYSHVDPSISGTLGPTSSGDVGESYGLPSFGYKSTINDKLDFALIYDQPYGAHVSYSPGYALSDPFDPATALSAEATTHALSAILRYKLDQGFSVFGGLRLQSAEASISVPAAGNYTMN